VSPRLGAALFDLANRALADRDVRRSGARAAATQRVDRVRTNRYALDNAEHEDFIHCGAAPIRTSGGAEECGWTRREDA
jgi:hypothetical protein